MIRRRLLMLSASAALHVAALGLALAAAGAGAAPAILMELVTDRPDDLAHEAPARPSSDSASVRSAQAPTVRARRMTATPAPRGLSANSPVPAPVQTVPVAVEPAPIPKQEAPAEIRAKTEPPPETGVALAPIARLPDPAGPPAPQATQPPGSSRASESGPRDESAATAPGAASDGGTAPSTRGSTGAGSAAGGDVALRTPGETRGGIPAEYSLYYQSFRQRVKESLQYPLAARRRGLSGRVELEVLVEPSGRIGAVRVISSSSHAVLDDAALQAVRRLPPQPLPDHLPRQPLRIRLPLDFELE